MIGADFNNLCRIVKERSGLHLTASRAHMVASRLGPLAQRLGHRGVQEFLLRLRHETSEAVLCQVVNALTTHESFFFRDRSQFETLAHDVLPELMRARAHEKRIRIWSAACSHGQEPYSLAMLVADMGLLAKGWSVEIVATDYSQTALGRAQQARYSQFEVRRGLDDIQAARYFDRDGEDCVLKAPLRDMVQFQKHNLLEDARVMGRFDIIFCRNVLFYFDRSTKLQALGAIQAAMALDGVLVLACSETAIGETLGFVPHARERGLFRQTGAEPRLRFARAANA